ncbi:MAG: hypothetical protein ACTSY1_13245 [Alphaproteobacteria bacterium]
MASFAGVTDVTGVTSVTSAVAVASALVVGAGLLLWSQFVMSGAGAARQQALDPGSARIISLKFNPLARRLVFEELALARLANATSLARVGRFASAARQAGRAKKTFQAAILRAPIASNAWALLAGTTTQIEGATQFVSASLERSHATGPRLGWVAPRRAKLALLIWPVLAPQVRQTAAREIARMPATRVGANALAKIYLELGSKLLRAPLVDSLKSAPIADQRRFLAAVEKLIPKE